METGGIEKEQQTARKRLRGAGENEQQTARNGLVRLRQSNKLREKGQSI